MSSAVVLAPERVRRWKTSGDWALVFHPDRESGAVRVIRDVLRALLSGRHPPDFTDTACLLASEVVSNALVHTRGPVEIRLREVDSVVRLDALDEGSGQAAVRDAGQSGESGRGLLIVDSCATRWGVQPRTDTAGKDVWFELAETRG